MCQSLKDVNYPGSESDWENITIETRNDVLSSEQVTIHYGVASTPVTEDMVTLSPTSYTYDGTAKTPDVTVTDGENTLRANVDYTVSYSNNINAGTGKVIINGKGTYKGTVEVPFTINPSALSACTVADIGNYGYTGSAITPPVIVLDGETVLKEDRDYTVSYDNNIAAGKATVTITGKGNYTGSLQKNFLITKEAELITAGTITLSASSVTYTGSAQKPAVTVKLGTKILKGGTDYDVRYSENTNVGTAGVTVTGKGNYSGTVQKTFKINPNAVSGTTATLSSTSYVYSGAAKSPAVAVKDGTKTLVKGTDYTVAYTNNTKAGTATVTITGKGNYGGTLKKTFTIKPRAISNTTATISKSIYLYTGSAVNPAVTVKDGTKTLTKGTDYTVSYSNNTKVGTATVTITGKGNYTGTLKKTFAIKKNFAKTSAALSATSYTYNGKAKTPSVTVKDGTKTLTKGTDYTVSYSNNTNVGTAAATITGKGNYSGTLKKTYKIVPAIPAVPAVENSASGLKVTWKKPAGAGGYYIYRSKDGSSDTKVKTITSGATLTWNDTGATANGSKYSYKVMAYKTVGEKTYKSAYSPAKVSYKISKPSLSLSNISQGVKLTVSKNGKATGYQMQISTLSDFSKKAEQKFTKTTWKIKLPDKIGKKCYLRVRTYKTVGSNTYYSVWSTVKSIVVKQ